MAIQGTEKTAEKATGNAKILRNWCNKDAKTRKDNGARQKHDDN